MITYCWTKVIRNDKIKSVTFSRLIQKYFRICRFVVQTNYHNF